MLNGPNVLRIINLGHQRFSVVGSKGKALTLGSSNHIHGTTKHEKN